MKDIMFEVVKNDEEQYSIWQADRAIPAGWHKIGKCDTKELCLEYIKNTWTDMRPLSLKNAMNKDLILNRT